MARYYFKDAYGSFEVALIAYTDASDAVIVAHTDTGLFNDCDIRTTHAYTAGDYDAVMDFAKEYDAETAYLWNGDGYTETGVK